MRNAGLPLTCPTCRLPLDERSFTCPAGHTFTTTGGVLSLLDAGFAERLARFTTSLQRYRAETGRRILDLAAYEELPSAPELRSVLEWRLRRYDLAVARRWAGSSPQRVLDIGAWNGWLSHRLSQLGHMVTAIDYFDDPYDGLGANRFYSTEWQAIQMDLTDLTPLPAVFDCIIVNRCLAFFGDPAGYVTEVRKRLAPGGRVLLTGLAFYRDPASKAADVSAMTRDYRQRYAAEMFLNETRGYLDGNDRRRLTAAGVRLRSYRRLALANLKAWIRPWRPSYWYGTIDGAEGGDSI